MPESLIAMRRRGESMEVSVTKKYLPTNVASGRREDRTSLHNLPSSVALNPEIRLPFKLIY